MTGSASPPELSAAEAEHGARLAARIRAAIDEAGGWIGFARYMEMALYEPGLGYYSAGARKLGEGGDFVTAPEVAPVFSRCLAGQCAEVLSSLGGGDVLELGAGSGAMAAIMLTEFESLGALPACYRILDVSADLRERQRATLGQLVPGLLERVEWLDRLPERHAGVILANEVLDALPVERFVIRGGEVRHEALERDTLALAQVGAHVEDPVARGQVAPALEFGQQVGRHRARPGAEFQHVAAA